MTMPFRSLAILALMLSGSVPSTALAQTASVDQRITTATGVRVRAEPSTAAAEVGKLKLGTLVAVVDESPAREPVNGASGSWLRIAPVDGVEGWIFGAFATPHSDATREAILLRIAAARLALAEPSFGDMADLEAFAARVAPGLSTAGRATLELARLRATARAAESVPFDREREEPYASWLAARSDLVFHDEIQGAWLMKTDPFWDGAARYASLPIGEEFAWAGAQGRLGGECETYLPCHIHRFAETEGRYLELYPRGRHAAEALGTIRGFLADVLADPQTWDLSPEHRSDLREATARLRAQVAKTSGPASAAVLAALDRIAKLD